MIIQFSFKDRFTAHADNEISGRMGDNVIFSIDKGTGLCTVSGTGAIPDYKQGESPVFAYRDIIRSLKIDHGITAIGTNSFICCFGLHDISFPDTLTTIKADAIIGASACRRIYVPSTVTNIEDYALGYKYVNRTTGKKVPADTMLIGPSGSFVQTYANNMKNKGKDSKSLKFHDDTLIRGYMDGGTLDDAVSDPEKAYFVINPKDGTLNIYPGNDGDGYLPKYTYYSSETKELFSEFNDLITEINVGEGITDLNRYTFYNLKNIKKISLPDSLMTFDRPFYDCDYYGELTLPAGITKLDSASLSFAKGNIKVKEGGSNESGGSVTPGSSAIVASGGVVYTDNGSSLIYVSKYYRGENFIIGNNVTKIDQKAFSINRNIKNLIFTGKIPGVIKDINDYYSYSSSTYTINIYNKNVYYDSSKAGDIAAVDYFTSDENNISDSVHDLSGVIGTGNIRVSTPSAMMVNTTEKLSIKYDICSFDKCSFSSSDPSVALVSDEGIIYAVKPGETTVTVASPDSKQSETVSVSVAGNFNGPASADISQIPAEAVEYGNENIKTPEFQIPVSEVNGIYFFTGKKLGIYSFSDNKYTYLRTFEGKASSAYYSDTKRGKFLYINDDQSLIEYDLLSQQVTKKIYSSDLNISTGAADPSGRIFMAGDRDGAPVIQDYSSDGKLISETYTPTAVSRFSGFSENGEIYFVDSDCSYFSYYDRYGKALNAGSANSDKISPIDFSSSLTENGSKNISTDGILFLNEDSYLTHTRPSEMIGGKYLAAVCVPDKVLNIYDTSTVKDLSIAKTASIDREPGEDSDSYSDYPYTDYDSAGTRAVYYPANDSFIYYANDNTIKEIGAADGKEKASYKTKNHVYSLSLMGSYIIAIEKIRSDKSDTYFLETIKWAYPDHIRLSAKNNTIAVGGSTEISCDIGNSLVLPVNWKSSDNSVAAVSSKGRVTGWKSGSAVIIASLANGSKAEIRITVSPYSSKNPKTATVLNADNLYTNVNDNNYESYGKIINSYLYETSDGYGRVQYDEDNKKLFRMSLGKDFSELSKDEIQMELPLFGGFYSGRDYNFLVFGQFNEMESNDREVLRCVKYDKNWKRIGSLSVKGANTYHPFDAGSCRMTEVNGRLYIHTCHTMYITDDKAHHQANMTYVINESDMKLADKNYDITNFEWTGYVSHSFNQFVLSDDNYLYRVDHGDAYPRGVVMSRAKSGADIKKIEGITVYDIEGEVGNNYTGVSVGGAESSYSNILVAGNSIDQQIVKDQYDAQEKLKKNKENALGTSLKSSQASDAKKTEEVKNEQRNIFISAVPKEGSKANVIKITDYKENYENEVLTPHLTKLSDDSFLLMWVEKPESADGVGSYYYDNSDNDSKSNKNFTTCLAHIDSDGNLVGNIVKKHLPLSDCKPILCKDGLVRWYYTISDKGVFYVSIDPYDLEGINDSEPEKSPDYKLRQYRNNLSKNNPFAASSKLFGEELKNFEKSIKSRKKNTAPDGAVFSLLRANGEAKSADSVKLSWIKVKGCSGYVIYGAKCGNKFKKVKELKKSTKVSTTVKKLKKNNYYKYIVVSYMKGKFDKSEKSQKRILSVSDSIIVTPEGGKSSNYAGVKLKKIKLSKANGTKELHKTLGAASFIYFKLLDRTCKLKAAAVKNKGSKVKKYRGLKIESSNPDVISPLKSMKLTSKSDGDCTVFIYDQSGQCVIIIAEVDT